MRLHPYTLRGAIGPSECLPAGPPWSVQRTNFPEPEPQQLVNLRSARTWGRVRRTIQNYSRCFRVARNPLRVQAKRGGHFLQAYLSLLIGPTWIASGLPTIRSESQFCFYLNVAALC